MERVTIDNLYSVRRNMTHVILAISSILLVVGLSSQMGQSWTYSFDYHLQAVEPTASSQSVDVPQGQMPAEGQSPSPAGITNAAESDCFEVFLPLIFKNGGGTNIEGTPSVVGLESDWPPPHQY